MHKSGLYRPGPAPLHLGNERNRSNSESVLPGAQNNRSKRMGMIKKKNDLGTVDEGQPKRTSFHLRGQSHASALRDWDHDGISVDTPMGNGHPASRLESQEAMHPLGALTSYLARSQKHAKHRQRSTFIDGAKGLRYALVTLDQATHSLLGSLPDRSTKQWYKLGDAQHEATFRMDNLHHSVDELVRFQEGSFAHSPRYSKEKAVSLSSNACQSAISKYIYLCKLLADQSSQMMATAEKSYIRTLILVTLGSSAELCHAYHRSRRRSSKRTTITQQKLMSRVAPIQASHHALREEPIRDQSVTPTRERPVTAKRVKNFNSPPPPQSNIPTTVKPPAPAQPSVPLYFNGRSRSNSRADQYSLPSSTDSTFAMSPAMTPSTMSQFSVPSTPLNRSRSSSIAASAHGGRITPAMNQYLENDHGAQAGFDKIYTLLEETVVLCRKVIPILEVQLRGAANEAQRDPEKAVRDEWSRRVNSCFVTLELSNIMLKRLQAVRYQDPHLRNEKSFWELCKKFLAATSELLMDVRAGYSEGYIHKDIVNLVRPVHKLSRQAGHEINDSPWIHLCSPPPGRLGTATSSSTTAASSPNSVVPGFAVAGSSY
ncbi:MAG: hypothetical protein Q9218_006302, partial [Villophora microphyllina]